MALAVPILALACFEIATWTPPVHEVHTRGAAAVKAYFASGWAFTQGPVPKPTTSLDQLRCDLWRGLPPCADPGTLGQLMFPDITQQPNTLYVPQFDWEVPSDNPSGWNVEYDASHRTLLIHTYESQPLLVTRRETVGIAAKPSVRLLLVATDAIAPGTINVVEDTRIERLFGDQTADRYLKGTPAIP